MKKIMFYISIIVLFFCYDNVLAKEGWATEDNNVYYYVNNEKIKGFQEIEGKTYFFSNVNYALKTGIQYIEGKPFYLNENGEVVKGFKKIDGKTYYFGEDNFAIKGFQEIEGKTYFFSNINYALKTGIQYIEGKPFYLNENGEVVKGLTKIDGKTYYFGEDNFAIKGFQEIEGKTYFFSNINYALKTGMQYIEGKPFYLNENGEVVKGFKKIDGKTYYFGEDNFAVKGFQEIEGKTYFFSNINYALKTGWQNINLNYWYQNENGEVVKGNQTIDGRNYNFDSVTGYLLGFKLISNKLYYYNPDGTQAKGVQYMTNNFWKFNELTGEFEKFVRQIRVIDISSHNGNIDWQTVKNSNLVDAVILRLGYGVGYIDSSFIRNKNELERLGIPYSVYLFSYAENANEALMESNFLVNTIRSYNIHIASNVLGIYYDLEDWKINSTGENSYGISKDTYGQMITTFVDNTEKNLCIKTRVYASKNYIETRFPDYAKNYATWVAQWSDNFTYQGPYDGWQYTSNGTIPGINGRVDQSLFYY